MSSGVTLRWYAVTPGRKPPSGAGRIWYWSCPSPGPSALPRDSPKAASRFSPPRGCWTCWPSAASAETPPPLLRAAGALEDAAFQPASESGADQGGQLCRRPSAGRGRPALPVGRRAAVRPQQHPWASNTAGRCCVCGSGSCAVYRSPGPVRPMTPPRRTPGAIPPPPFGTCWQKAAEPMPCPGWFRPCRAVYEAEEAAGRAPVFAAACERAILARLRSMTPGGFRRVGHRTRGRRPAAVQRQPERRHPRRRSRRRQNQALRLRPAAADGPLGLSGPDPRRAARLMSLTCGFWPPTRPAGRCWAGCGKPPAFRSLRSPPPSGPLCPDAQASLPRLESRAADLYALAYPELTAACRRYPLAAESRHALTHFLKGVPHMKKYLFSDPDPMPAGRCWAAAACTTLPTPEDP